MTLGLFRNKSSLIIIKPKADFTGQALPRHRLAIDNFSPVFPFRDGVNRGALKETALEYAFAVSATQE